MLSCCSAVQTSTMNAESPAAESPAEAAAPEAAAPECVVGSQRCGVLVRAVKDLGHCKLIIAQGSVVDFSGAVLAGNSGPEPCRQVTPLSTQPILVDWEVVAWMVPYPGFVFATICLHTAEPAQFGWFFPWPSTLSRCLHLYLKCASCIFPLTRPR